MKTGRKAVEQNQQNKDSDVIIAFCHFKFINHLQLK